MVDSDASIAAAIVLFADRLDSAACTRRILRPEALEKEPEGCNRVSDETNEPSDTVDPTPPVDENDDTTKKTGRKSHRFWISILLIIGLILTPLSMLALFMRSEISESARATCKPSSRCAPAPRSRPTSRSKSPTSCLHASTSMRT